MIRRLLESSGVSVAVAMLWFFGMPVMIQKVRGGGLAVRIRRNLPLGALMLFAACMMLCYTARISEPRPLFVWHVMCFLLCFMGAHAITTWMPRAFAYELVAILRPASIIPLLLIFAAFMSHMLQALVLLPQALVGTR